MTHVSANVLCYDWEVWSQSDSYSFIAHPFFSLKVIRIFHLSLMSLNFLVIYLFRALFVRMGSIQSPFKIRFLFFLFVSSVFSFFHQLSSSSVFFFSFCYLIPVSLTKSSIFPRMPFSPLFFPDTFWEFLPSNLPIR